MAISGKLQQWNPWRNGCFTFGLGETLRRCSDEEGEGDEREEHEGRRCHCWMPWRFEQRILRVVGGLRGEGRGFGEWERFWNVVRLVAVENSELTWIEFLIINDWIGEGIPRGVFVIWMMGSFVRVFFGKKKSIVVDLSTVNCPHGAVAVVTVWQCTSLSHEPRGIGVRTNRLLITVLFCCNYFINYDLLMKKFGYGLRAPRETAKVCHVFSILFRVNYSRILFSIENV